MFNHAVFVIYSEEKKEKSQDHRKAVVMKDRIKKKKKKKKWCHTSKCYLLWQKNILSEFSNIKVNLYNNQEFLL